MPLLNYTIIESPGFLGTHRSIKELNTGTVMYGGDVKSLLSSIWSAVKPIIGNIAKSPKTKEILAGVASKAISSGVDHLNTKLSEPKSSSLSPEARKALQGLLQHSGKGIKYIKR